MDEPAAHPDAHPDARANRDARRDSVPQCVCVACCQSGGGSGVSHQARRNPWSFTIRFRQTNGYPELPALPGTDPHRVACAFAVGFAVARASVLTPG